MIGGAHSPGSLCGVQCDLDCFQKPCAVPWTCAPSQLMMWLVVWACTDSGHHFLQLVVFGHSNLQSSLSLSNVYLAAVVTGAWYTTSSFFTSGIFCFTLTSSCFRVSWGLKTAFTPRGAQTFCNLSLRPRTSTTDTPPPLCTRSQ